MTNFTDMTPDDRADWISWAKSHDWGATARFETAQGFAFLTIMDQDRDDWCGGGHTNNFIRGNDRLAFGTPKSLREWAGY